MRSAKGPPSDRFDCQLLTSGRVTHPMKEDVKKKLLPSRPPASMIGSLQLALPLAGATQLRLPRLVPSRATYQRPFNSRSLAANPRHPPEAARFDEAVLRRSARTAVPVTRRLPQALRGRRRRNDQSRLRPPRRSRRPAGLRRTVPHPELSVLSPTGLGTCQW